MSAPPAARPAVLAGVLATLWWWLVCFLQLTIHNQLGLDLGLWAEFLLPGAVLAALVGGIWGACAALLLARRVRSAVVAAAALPLVAIGLVQAGRLVRAYGNRIALLGEPTTWAFALATLFVLLALLLRRRLSSLAAVPLAAIAAVLLAPLAEPDTDVAREERESLDAALQARTEEDSPRRMLVFGVDGLDPRVLRQLVAAGELPNFARLLERGCLEPLETYQPTLSPLIWTTIATGWPWRLHGVGDFTVTALPGAPRPLFLSTTLVEHLWYPSSRLLGHEPARYLISSFQRRRRAFWEVFGEAGVPCAVVDWWATHPARPFDGILASDQAFTDRTLKRFHEEGGAVLAGSVHPAGGEGGDFEPLLARVLAPAAEQSRQERIQEFYGDVREPGRRYLELELPYVRQSLRAAGFLEELMREDRARVYVFYTRIVDTSSHLYWQFWQPGDPAYASKPPPAELAATLGDMVPRAHRLADALLGEMLDILGEDAAVVVLSDHGFHAVPRKSATTAGGTMLPVSGHHWRAPAGVFAAAGPGIQPGAEVSLGVHDVLPTLAWWMGIPLAANLPGQVRQGVFSAALAARDPGQVPTWEIVGEDTMAAIPVEELSPEEASGLNQLGYIGK